MKIIINGEMVSAERLDQWKLKRISKVLKTLNRGDLLAKTAEKANAQLAEIKQGYSYGEILSLLKGRLALGALTMKVMGALSFGGRRFAVTEIDVEGLSAGEMIKALDALMLEPSKENDRVNLSACPDHYALRPLGGSRLEVIETCGSSPMPVQFFIVYGDETGLHTPRDSSYEQQSAGAARLGDGTLIGGVRHQFKDTPKGFRAKLVVEFPILTPGFIVRSHQMHLACEFSHWFGWIKGNRPQGRLSRV